VSPITKATFRSLALQAVVADTKELRTAPYDAALPVLFVREQIRTEGFETLCRHASSLSPMSWLFIFLFYASRHASHGLRFEKRSIPQRMLMVWTSIAFGVLLFFSGAGFSSKKTFLFISSVF
jgi:hypothetical protein